MVVLPGSRQSQKVALLQKVSESSDHELQETVQHMALSPREHGLQVQSLQLISMAKNGHF